MRVQIDKDACLGEETCVEICPDVFEMKDEAASAKMEIIPEELEIACREAAEACPAEAILIKK
jgi:ferredoxin